MSYQTLQTIQEALETSLTETRKLLEQYQSKLHELTTDTDYETTLFLERKANKHFFKIEDIKIALEEVNEELTIIRYRAEGRNIERMI